MGFQLWISAIGLCDALYIARLSTPISDRNARMLTARRRMIDDILQSRRLHARNAQEETDITLAFISRLPSRTPSQKTRQLASSQCMALCGRPLRNPLTISPSISITAASLSITNGKTDGQILFGFERHFREEIAEEVAACIRAEALECCSETSLLLWLICIG